MTPDAPHPRSNSRPRSRPRFRRLLITLFALAFVALAGCAAAPGGPGAGGPTDGQTATPYPNETVTFPSGPKERPDLPDRLTAETAADYVVTHEFRYSYNQFHEPGATVGMSEASCSVQSTEAAGDGYLVTVRCTAYVNRPVEDRTVTEHADYPPWTVEYYVDGNSVLRQEQ